ncbi:MAG: hypothetical protein ACK5MU_01920 [Candidatus Saccharimonadales bacterium]
MADANMSMKNLPKQQRAAIGMIIGIFIIVIMAAIITMVSRIGKIEVEVKIAPFDTTITLNGTEIKNDSSSYIAPGTYELVAEREHFETKTETIIISESNSYIVGKLIASDEEGEKIMEERADDYLAVEGVMGKIANEEGAAIKEKWPILKYLPINNNFYSISYAYDSENEPIITVKADVKYIDIAVQKMKSFSGVDLTEYEIIFNTGNFFTDFIDNDETNGENFIRTGFASVIGDKVIGQGGSSGDYYYTTIYTVNYDTDDVYGHFRILIKKNGSKWELVSQPQPLLTKENTSDDVPKEILDAANNL